MDVVRFRVEDFYATEQSQHDVVPGVVDPREDSADGQEQYCADDVDGQLEVPGAQQQREEVVVLAQEELDRVDVDGVDVGTTGRLLDVVVLVDERIYRFDVQSPVKEGVEEIVHDEQDWKRKQRVIQRQIRKVPCHGGFEVAESQVKVHERRRRRLRYSNEEHVLGCEVVQVLAPHGDRVGFQPNCSLFRCDFD